MSNLKIDGERLWNELMETAAIGGTPKGGICRLTLTDLDGHVRDWFKARGGSARLHGDGRRHGRHVRAPAGPEHDVPPIAMGSHLDTQPTGGKFDGALGVLAALEALRTLHEQGYETFAPIEVVNWTNEEGSRFAPAMLASGVFAGVFERDWAVAREDRAGVTFGDALEAIGYRGPERVRRRASCRPSSSCISSRARSSRPKAGHRRRHRRAGHALVRGHGDRPRLPCRHHPDGCAARCAAMRRAHRRARQHDRPGARAARGREPSGASR